MSRRNTPPNTQAQTKAPRLQPNYKQPKTPNTRVQAPVPVPPQTGDYGQAASPNPRTNRHPSQNPDIPTTGATAQDKPTDTGTSLAVRSSRPWPSPRHCRRSTTKHLRRDDERGSGSRSDQTPIDQTRTSQASGADNGKRRR